MTPIWSSLLGFGMALLGLFLPFTAATPINTLTSLGPLLLILLLSGTVLALIGRVWAATLVTPIALAATLLAVDRLSAATASGGSGYWLAFWGLLLATLSAIGRVSLVYPSEDEGTFLKRLRSLLPPTSVPAIILLLWQGVVVGYQVPKGIFPGITDVAAVLNSSLSVLLADSYVTFIKEVLLGFLFGLGSGFLVGVAISYSRFLQRGFLPLAAAFGAVPIVGLAPVLGRAFGVDWESKAAVVVIVTFFPVVLNVVQGLILIDPLKLELLEAYAAGPREIFLKLRLPNALPFLFNALKLAAVLSVISVIVAEFLIPGPPEGLGQRISLSARRGAYDVVFAAIFVSSLISIAFYGFLSVLERWLTGWHASFREEGV